MEHTLLAHLTQRRHLSPFVRPLRSSRHPTHLLSSLYKHWQMTRLLCSPVSLPAVHHHQQLPLSQGVPLGVPRHQRHLSLQQRQHTRMPIPAQPMMALSLVLYNCVWPSASQHLLKQPPHGRSPQEESLQLGTQIVTAVISLMVLHVLFVLQELTIIFRQQVCVQPVALAHIALLVRLHQLFALLALSAQWVRQLPLHVYAAELTWVVA